MVASLVALGVSFQMLARDSHVGWCAALAMLGLKIGFSVSLGPLPYIITAEIFPSSSRAAGVSICWFINWAANCAVSLAFPPLMVKLSPPGVFFTYAAVCALAVAFVKFGVPETSGRALEPSASEDARAVKLISDAEHAGTSQPSSSTGAPSEMAA